MPSLFSKIIAREIPSYMIYEDEYTYAFLDIFPQQIGHTLIVPKIEIDHFSDVPEPYSSAIFQTAKKLAPAIKQATNCTRVCSMFVGYEIPHCHYHLIPTNQTQDLDHTLAHPIESQDLEEMQKKIISFL
jgi:histidine triad (HIT) family protein